MLALVLIFFIAMFFPFCRCASTRSWRIISGRSAGYRTVVQTGIRPNKKREHLLASVQDMFTVFVYGCRRHTSVVRRRPPAGRAVPPLEVYLCAPINLRWKTLISFSFGIVFLFFFLNRRFRLFYYAVFNDRCYHALEWPCSLMWSYDQIHFLFWKAITFRKVFCNNPAHDKLVIILFFSGFPAFLILDPVESTFTCLSCSSTCNSLTDFSFCSIVGSFFLKL